MIENNDEAKRSKIWTVVTSVTSVLIIIVSNISSDEDVYGKSVKKVLGRMRTVI